MKNKDHLYCTGYYSKNGIEVVKEKAIQDGCEISRVVKRYFKDEQKTYYRLYVKSISLLELLRQ